MHSILIDKIGKNSFHHGGGRHQNENRQNQWKIVGTRLL